MHCPVIVDATRTPNSLPLVVVLRLLDIKIVDWIKNNTVSKEDTFYFMHHATENRTYPCDTIVGTGKRRRREFELH